MEAIEEQIPAAEMERMMKAQEVILKAAAGKLTWMAAAEIMGVTDRTMRRWRERLNEHGYSGLWDYRKRRPSPKRVPMATVEQVLQLYRGQYFDFNVRHFHEKLREAHGIKLSYSWVKTALQTAGFVEKRRPEKHRKEIFFCSWRLCLQATGIYRFWPELLDREQARACPRSPGPEPALELRPRIALSSAQVKAE